jgi:hypothetical protein
MSTLLVPIDGEQQPSVIACFKIQQAQTRISNVTRPVDQVPPIGRQGDAKTTSVSTSQRIGFSCLLVFPVHLAAGVNTFLVKNGHHPWNHCREI